MYSGQKAKIISDTQEEMFKLNKGVKQGDPLCCGYTVRVGLASYWSLATRTLQLHLMSYYYVRVSQ